MNNGVTAKLDEDNDLGESCEHIHTRADFIGFLHTLRGQLQRRPEEWENRDLPAYLDALTAWVEDMEGYYKNRGETVPDQPTWKTLGQILLAAKVYE